LLEQPLQRTTCV